ncbi:hypothetical protein QC762_0099700 [Podospora pseudocomata]|uniref:Uncharacterized protein n=1 Tax=Podospora pseudocomata TaxID=2093779 RepID=A0ABR0G902_9PEZI|nr:hypothetical protein QC762_0099700 [Podospora pseudocomata]
MHAFDETFMLLRQQRVVICRSCHHAVLPGSVRTDVNTQHRCLPNPERRQIVERALELEKESVLSSDINSIRFPGREDAAVPDLPVWTDGRQDVFIDRLRRRPVRVYSARPARYSGYLKSRRHVRVSPPAQTGGRWRFER